MLLALLVIPAIGFPHDGHPRRDRTVLDIENLEKAFKLYSARTGHFPDSTTGFDVLIDMGIIDRMPRDGWGNPYLYELVDGRPQITSLGRDGLPGGEGDDADLTNSSSVVIHR